MNKNIVIIVVIALVASAGAYWVFFMNTGNDAPITAVPAASQTQIQFETLRSKLPTSLDTSLFSDSRFKTLVDITQPIQPEPAGRLDPLAPIAGVTGT